MRTEDSIWGAVIFVVGKGSNIASKKLPVTQPLNLLYIQFLDSHVIIMHKTFRANPIQPLSFCTLTAGLIWEISFYTAHMQIDSLMFSELCYFAATAVAEG